MAEKYVKITTIASTNGNYLDQFMRTFFIYLHLQDLIYLQNFDLWML